MLETISSQQPIVTFPVPLVRFYLLSANKLAAEKITVNEVPPISHRSPMVVPKLAGNLQIVTNDFCRVLREKTND